LTKDEKITVSKESIKESKSNMEIGRKRKKDITKEF